MNNYPIITIPGPVVSKKTSPELHCLPTGRKEENIRSKRVCKDLMRPMISDGISKSEKNTIILYMRRAWGLPTIKTPVNVAFRFYIPKYPILPSLASRDLSNAYQLDEDLMQGDIYKTPTRGQFAGIKVLSSSGAGIIENDNLIQGHDGSRFVYLCHCCRWGITGKRRSFIRDKEKQGCPGSTKCPDQRIEIEITDMFLNEKGFYECF